VAPAFWWTTVAVLTVRERTMSTRTRRSVRFVEPRMSVDETPDQYEWMFRGRCQDTDPGLFFPSEGVGVALAQRVCAECPVVAECLEYALINGIEHGVWGGTSERERNRIRRRRSERLVAPSG